MLTVVKEDLYNEGRDWPVSYWAGNHTIIGEKIIPKNLEIKHGPVP